MVAMLKSWCEHKLTTRRTAFFRKSYRSPYHFLDRLSQACLTSMTGAFRDCTMAFKSLSLASKRIDVRSRSCPMRSPCPVPEPEILLLTMFSSCFVRSCKYLLVSSRMSRFPKTSKNIVTRSDCNRDVSRRIPSKRICLARASGLSSYTYMCTVSAALSCLDAWHMVCSVCLGSYGATYIATLMIPKVKEYAADGVQNEP